MSIITTLYSEENTQKSAIISFSSIIIFFIFIIFTIFVTSTVPNKSAIIITNSSNDPNLSKIDFDKIISNIETLMVYSYNATPEQIHNLRAVVRENTIEYTLDDSGKIANAKYIIDLNEPNVTFLVDDQASVNFVALTCPPTELVQNPNVFCIGYGGQSTIDANLKKYLPYQGKTSDGIDFRIWLDPDDSNKPRLGVYANICDNETTGKSVNDAVKYWLIQHGIPNPDIIPLNLDYSYCPHLE